MWYYQAMYYERTLFPIIENATDTFPAVLVTGPRQVGKTTIFEHNLDGRNYVSLDLPSARELAQRDPALFFKTYTPPLMIDEVQYAPELFPYIKIIIDTEKKNGLFWLTGSQIFHLMKNVTESLAGRVAILNLQGFSQAEKLGKPDITPFLPSFEIRKDVPIFSLSDVYEMIWKGSYPRLIINKNASWKLFYDSYISTYLERDVRAILNITQEHSFLQFLRAAAARTGQLLNCSDMARDVDVSVNTIKAWLSVLETSGLIFFLYPYSNNLTSRVAKTPKLYFFDTGLACWLTGWDNANVLENGAMSGAMLETYVISEIIKSYWHNGERANIYFYRDKDKKEIDLIIERRGVLHPIEIKRTASPNLKDVKNFEILKRTGRKTGIGGLICLIDTPLPLKEDVMAIPVSYLT